jgi:hypothetical protein
MQIFSEGHVFWQLSAVGGYNGNITLKIAKNIKGVWEKI